MSNAVYIPNLLIPEDTNLFHAVARAGRNQHCLRVSLDRNRSADVQIEPRHNHAPLTLHSHCNLAAMQMVHLAILHRHRISDTTRQSIGAQVLVVTRSRITLSAHSRASKTPSLKSAAIFQNTKMRNEILSGKLRR